MPIERERVFLKLGGSLLTDKTQPEAVRLRELTRLAGEIAAARAARPGLQLLIGHGSGSFGHVAAARHGTRTGVQTPAQWRGFAEVAAAAARLNALVRDALLTAGVNVVSLLPSSSAECVDGALHHMAVAPIRAALAADLTPLVMGDVAFDRVRGGVIVSTEEVFAYLVERLAPQRLLLAGETAGVYDAQGELIPRITPADFPAVRSALGGSRGADVTGGMLTKVEQMLALVAAHPALTVRIFSGLAPGNLTTVLCDPAAAIGTELASRPV